MELKNVNIFPYLGRIMSNVDNDAPAVQARLKKARASWAHLGKVLRAENVSSRVSTMFYWATIQAVLLSGSEIWTFTLHLLASLEGFHGCAALRITGLMPKRSQSGQWLYPKSATVLKAAGLLTINQYIDTRRHTVSRYITHRPVYDTVMNPERLTGTLPRQLWCNQDLDLPEIYQAPLPLTLRNDSAAVVRGRAHSAPPRAVWPDGRLRYMDAPEGGAVL